MLRVGFVGIAGIIDINRINVIEIGKIVPTPGDSLPGARCALTAVTTLVGVSACPYPAMARLSPGLLPSGRTLLF
jgi:hypothetical protein